MEHRQREYWDRQRKDEGYKLYSITKEVAKVSFCCFQEVKYRNKGSKVISSNSGEIYTILWCGQKKRRSAGVGILIKKCPEICYDDPDFNINFRRFSIRLVNVYAPT